ncbi:MAG: hypothetical protein JKX84_04745 [Flavobacteriales bacterium]|nr:hypothetical protein [Flavobacteriales bacterium]
MKTSYMRFVLILIFVANVFTVSAQAPQAFNYQGVARDSDGDPLTDQDIGILLSILSGAINGPVEYQEEHSVLTDAYGYFTLKIGEGTASIGLIDTVDWGDSSYFLKLGMDVLGGSNFVEMGTTQFLSVPYALYANRSDTSDYATSSNQLLTPAFNGQTLVYNNGLWEASSMIYNDGWQDNVGIGTYTPHPNAVLDISSIDKGILIPRLNIIQIALMSVDQVDQGLLVYDVDADQFRYRNDTAWVYIESSVSETNETPSGLISMWSGTITSIPTGYALCDGSNGTPDLTDKFIISVASAAEDPGSVQGVFVDVETGAAVAPDRQFFKLAYIIKL